MSMKLYADRLERALRPYTPVCSVHPWQPIRRNWLPVPVRQGLDYTLRYVTYPNSLSRHSADVFHIVDHAYAHLLRNLPAERAVVTCHDLMPLKLAAGEFGTQRDVPRIATALFRKSLSHLHEAAAIISVSHATARDLMKYLGIPSHKIAVIHHGVEGEYRPIPDGHLRDHLRARYGLAEHAVLLHVSGNSFYKNLEGIVRALGCLRTLLAGVKPLLIKAGKPLSPAQRKLADQLGVLPLIREMGPLSRDTMQQLYWAADVMVFPSLWEGFGWPPLEAMASGTPVVTTHCGALREVAGDAAEIVEPDDPEDIARGIARLLRDTDRRRELICQGFCRTKLFRWEEAAKKVLSVYESFTENSSRNESLSTVGNSAAVLRASP